MKKIIGYTVMTSAGFTLARVTPIDEAREALVKISMYNDAQIVEVVADVEPELWVNVYRADSGEPYIDGDFETQNEALVYKTSPRYIKTVRVV